MHAVLELKNLMIYDTIGTYMGVAKYLISHDVTSANDIVLHCIELIISL